MQKNINNLVKIKVFFSRTTGPMSTKCGSKHFLVEGIQLCLKKGTILSRKGNNKYILIVLWLLLNFLLTKKLTKKSLSWNCLLLGILLKRAMWSMSLLFRPPIQNINMFSNARVTILFQAKWVIFWIWFRVSFDAFVTKPEFYEIQLIFVSFVIGKFYGQI